MTTHAKRLSSTEQLSTCVDLQQSILGERARSIWSVSALTAVCQSGGLILGACASEDGSGTLHGALVDLVAEVDGYPARHTVFHGVRPSQRNRGLGAALRRTERTLCQRAGTDLIFWALDPLRSTEAHLALVKLGAIGTGYRRDQYGEICDNVNRGLATDRLRIEWWIDSPRVESILDRGDPPPQLQLGIHQMDGMTETRLLRSGVRALVGHDQAPRADHVLAEIPTDLDRVRALDPEEARNWRLQSRNAFELLFERGYVAAGFIHEGGRSFHLFRRADRRAVLQDHWVSK